MINYMSNFIQNHSLIIMVIVLSFVFLSFASKRFRTFVYSGLITGSISLMIAILHKLGYGFTIFYCVIERIVLTITKSIEIGQSFLISGKTAFSATLVSLDSDQMFRLLALNDTFYTISLRVIVLELCAIFDEIKIAVEKKIEIIKERLVVKNINRMTLNCVYRL